MATAVVAYKQAFGFDAPGYTLKDVELSDTIIFIGANPVVAHPVLWNRVRRTRKDTDRIIVIDPRKSHTAEEADYHYAIDHSSDLTLLYTVANLLIENRSIDREFIENHTNHFEEFKEFVSEFTLEKGVEKTGLTENEILEFVELIETGEKVSFWWTMGVNQHHEGVRVAQAIINLALMTGNIGKPGTGANSLTGQTDAMGSRLFSNTTALHGGYDFDDEKGRKKVSEVLQVDESYLADGPTLPYNELIEGINKGDIKALWVICTNPRHSWTNNETFKEAINKLELFVVQDIYEDTETSSEASVFLPVIPAIKKEGTIINTERRLSPVRPVLERGENELTDYEVIKGIGEAMGMDLSLWETPQDAFNLMREISRGQPCDITGVDWDTLTRSKGIQWPYPEGQEITEDERRLYEDGQFYTENGRANFVFETPQDNPNQLTKEFPTMLNTGRNSAAIWHTRSRTREIPAAQEIYPEDAYVILGSAFAEEMNVEIGDRVRIYSCNGQNVDLNVEIHDNQRNDEVFIPLHYIECNKLTHSVYDPNSKEPSYKDTPVRVEKIR
jgi:assimilatory nitrate reductase catalytic subunit